MSDKILGMSDEDFLKLDAPPVSTGDAGQGNQQTADEQAAAAEAAAQAEAASTAAAAERAAAVEAEAEAKRKEEEAAAEAAKTTSADATSGGKVSDDKAGEQVAAANASADGSSSGQEDKGKKDGDTKDEADASLGSKAAAATEPPDYEGFYKKIMSPLKANGKTINLNDPEEALKLMQMGANYTRKMQDLAPKRKLLLMLENNGLLDEGQLSFAIDLVKKNPDAIKKLLKDANIDPLDIDVKSEPTYREGNHRVSDDEASFVSTLEDIKSTPEGTQTLQVINTQWDQASKEVLWKSPEVIQVIHEQRANGVYERVAAEVDRLKALGTIPAQVPFLQAYKMVGDQLGNSGALNDLIKPKAAVTTSAAAPVAQTKAVVKPAIKNGDKASAAAATRTTTKTAELKINPLAQSDEDFMKQMANRL